MTRARARRATLFVSALTLSTLPWPAAAAASANGTAAAAPSSDAGRLALREAIWQLERSLRARLAATEGSGFAAPRGGAEGETRNAAELLDALRSDARTLGPAAAELLRKTAALRPLLHEVGRRESTGDAAFRGGSAWSAATPRRLPDNAGATCRNALAVGDGSFTAAIGAGARGRGDLWLRHTATAGGMALVSTAGSDFDTVVEVYRSCPVAGDAPVGRGDDEVGLQARAAFAAAAGETSLVRVSGWEGATGAATVELASGASGFGGTVTREDTAAPLGREVEAWTSGGSFAGSTATDGSGVYVFAGLSPGSYFASTQSYYYSSQGLLDELYDGVPCAGGAPQGCNPTTGSPIAVTAGVILDNVDFVLGSGGTITGRVRDGSTGLPLVSIPVSAFNAGGGTVALTSTDSAGRYQLSGLGGGPIYALAGNSFDTYRRELYQDIPCATGCDVTTGTPIPVTIGATTQGIDFALDEFGAIAGTVTDSAGTPAANSSVSVWNAAGQFVTASLASSGTYEIGGLDAGDYFVTASNADFLTELYDDVPCAGGTPAGCTLSSGTPVSVALATTTAGIDFALTRRGHIAGTVRDSSTNLPIPGAVLIYDASGAIQLSRPTNADGTYEITGLAAGSYLVIAFATAYVPQLYDHLQCPSLSCDPTDGEPITVEVETTASGIDFDLAPSGAITGVVKSADGVPLPSSAVALYDYEGTLWSNTNTDSQGRYRFTADPGTWFVVARGDDNFAAELYDDIPCPGGTCWVTTGTPVEVTGSAATSGIDFALAPARGIVGCVVDEIDRPLPGVAIDLWTSAGQHWAAAVTGPGGCYQLTPFNGGTYFVSTDNGLGAIDEIWDDVACPNGPAYPGLCDPTTGTPITLPSSSSLVTGIDFTLSGLQIFVGGFESGVLGWSAQWP